MAIICPPPTAFTTTLLPQDAIFVLPDVLKPRDDIPLFDVDSRTGFMASQPPITRLPPAWEIWESMLDEAISTKLQVGDKIGITPRDKQTSELWRTRVRQMPVLPTAELNTPVLLRRAHLVLAFLQHFYIQSIPPDTEILIPRPISIPILRVSQSLDIPPILTFSDTVLYNWHIDPESLASTARDVRPTPRNVRTRTMFTNSTDEEEFYLCSARIELRGVEALQLMRMTMDEVFSNTNHSNIAVRRSTNFLKHMANVIYDLRTLLLDVKKLCQPDIYYNEVRPWFRGEDSDLKKRKWVFEGVEEDLDLRQPTELSGPSAGQSSLVHVLDIFLGVDHQASTSPDRPSFMSRMQTYMPRNHRLFLNHLSTNPRPLRTFVLERNDKDLTNAYNEAVIALKKFRDAHMIIATLYIIGPARKAARAAMEKAGENNGTESVVGSQPPKAPLKGTGGTDLVKFLKDTRTRTTEAVIQE